MAEKIPIDESPPRDHPEEILRRGMLDEYREFETVVKELVTAMRLNLSELSAREKNALLAVERFLPKP